MISILDAVWEAAGFPCAVRLRALLPLWMPSLRKRFRPRPVTEQGVLGISARQIDRRLAERVGHRLYGDQTCRPACSTSSPCAPTTCG